MLQRYVASQDHLHLIVVSVAMRMVALAEYPPVLLVRQERRVKSVRCAERVAP